MNNCTINKLFIELKNKKFAFSKEFYTEWHSLYQKLPKDVVFLSKYDNRDDAQIFVYDYDNGERVSFNIQILKINPNKVDVVLEIKNNCIYVDDYKVQYTPCGTYINSEYNYSDIELVPILTKNSHLVVVDGNHSLTDKLKSGWNPIKAKYNDDFKAMIAISSPMEMFTYALYQSFWKIIYNLDTYKHKDLIGTSIDYINHILQVLKRRNILLYSFNFLER